MTPLVRDYVEAAIALGVPIAAGLIAWGSLRQRVNNAESSIGKNALVIEGFKRALYREDGTLVYVTAPQCGDMHNICRTAMCGKVDEMKKVMEDQNKRHTEDMIKISKFMGRMQEYMRRGEEDRRDARLHK